MKEFDKEEADRVGFGSYVYPWLLPVVRDGRPGQAFTRIGATAPFTVDEGDLELRRPRIRCNEVLTVDEILHEFSAVGNRTALLDRAVFVSWPLWVRHLATWANIACVHDAAAVFVAVMFCAPNNPLPRAAVEGSLARGMAGLREALGGASDAVMFSPVETSILALLSYAALARHAGDKATGVAGYAVRDGVPILSIHIRAMPAYHERFANLSKITEHIADALDKTPIAAAVPAVINNLIMNIVPPRVGPTWASGGVPS